MTPHHPAAVAIVARVAAIYGVSPELLWKEQRQPTLAEARHVAWWKTVEDTGWTPGEAAVAMGVDRVSLLHGLKKIRGHLEGETGTGFLRGAKELLRIPWLGSWQTVDEALGKMMAEQGASGSSVPLSPTPPIPSSLDKLSVSKGISASLLSSGSRPESKRARGPKPRLRQVPESWSPNDAHRDLARQLGVNFDQQLTQFRDHEFKDPKSNFDAAFRTWLRRANEYGARNGTPPGLQQHRQVQAEEARLQPIHDFLCAGDRTCRARKHDPGCPRAPQPGARP
jgi:hypothetical protein